MENSQIFFLSLIRKCFYFALFLDSSMKMCFTFIHDTVMQVIVSVLKLSMKCDLRACINDQLCSILCDPMDCSPPGSSIHESLLARTLEWVACPLPGDLSNPGIKPRSPTLQADSLPSEPPKT